MITNQHTVHLLKIQRDTLKVLVFLILKTLVCEFILIYTQTCMLHYKMTLFWGTMIVEPSKDSKSTFVNFIHYLFFNNLFYIFWGGAIIEILINLGYEPIYYIYLLMNRFVSFIPSGVRDSYTNSVKDIILHFKLTNRNYQVS